MSERASPFLLRESRPPISLGIVVAVGLVAAVTGIVYPLREVAPAVSTGVLYLLPVLVVSTFWGLALGLATGILSAAAFNFFHIPPTGEFTIGDEENWIALVTFLITAVIAGAGRGASRALAPPRRSSAAAKRVRRSRSWLPPRSTGGRSRRRRSRRARCAAATS